MRSPSPPEQVYCGYQLRYTAIGKPLRQPPAELHPEPSAPPASTAWPHHQNAVGPPHVRDLPVGAVAVRVFRAARKRRLALPPEQRKKLEPGLAQQLISSGWDLPADLLP
jgi:hypothetical protein